MGDAAEAPPSSAAAVVMSDDDAERGTAVKAPTAALPHHRAALSWEGLSVSVKVRQRAAKLAAHEKKPRPPPPRRRVVFARAAPEPRQPPAPPDTQDAKGATRNILKDAVGLVPPQTFCAVMVGAAAAASLRRPVHMFTVHHTAADASCSPHLANPKPACIRALPAAAKARCSTRFPAGLQAARCCQAP
jgi:hypothetical protein